MQYVVRKYLVSTFTMVDFLYQFINVYSYYTVRIYIMIRKRSTSSYSGNQRSATQNWPTWQLKITIASQLIVDTDRWRLDLNWAIHPNTSVYFVQDKAFFEHKLVKTSVQVLYRCMNKVCGGGSRRGAGVERDS